MNYENKYKIIYIILTLAVAGLILLLFLLTMQTIVYEQRKETLKNIQKTLIFVDKATKLNSTDKWEYIGEPRLRHQQYSAYFDPRTEIIDNSIFDEDNYAYGSIRIFAVLPLKLRSQTMYCVFRFQDNKTETNEAYEVLPIHENQDMKFSAYSILCPLINKNNEKFVKLPQYVSLSYTDNPSTLKLTYNLQINYPPENILIEPNNTLAVCIAPFLQHYSDALRLVEFVEMYKLLGAEKFYFYRLNVSSYIDRVLDYYEKQNTAQILNWNIDSYEIDKEIRYAAQMIELNECVYRATYMDGFKYVAVVDLDEIIMPLGYNTLVDFLNDVDDKRTSAFIFRNVFFHKHHHHDYYSVPKGIKNRFLYTQVIIGRTSAALPIHARSKYIVNARAAIEMGNHQIWRSLEGYSETNIKESDGLLFHYKRKCVTTSCSADTTGDYTARRYGSLIWVAVEDVCQNVFVEKNGVCPMK